jgi:hypothetical protein
MGTVAILHWKFTGGPMGIAGKIHRCLFWREVREVDRSRDAMESHPLAFEVAALEETLSAFEEQLDEAQLEDLKIQILEKRAELEAASEGREEAAPGPSPSVSKDVIFLFCVALGGLLSSLADGKFHLGIELDPAYLRLVASGSLGYLTLFLGGICVGVGTRMAGGCTTGHGLCGVARLQKGSLVATATFFGVGIVLSWWLAQGVAL